MHVEMSIIQNGIYFSLPGEIQFWEDNNERTKDKVSPRIGAFIWSKVDQWHLLSHKNMENPLPAPPNNFPYQLQYCT
jgi:hypothetical protein